MRKSTNNQQEIQFQIIDSDLGRELSAINQVLNSLPGFNDFCAEVLQNISSDSGTHGMSAEQVVRAGVLRTRLGMKYRELSHSSKDSSCVRSFLLISNYGKGFSKSALQNNLSKVSDKQWSKLSELSAEYAKSQGLETGSKQRVDTTTTKTNIHYPTDANLLRDSVRVLSRLMKRLKKDSKLNFKFHNHYKKTKKIAYKINNVRGQEKRKSHYLDLIVVAKRTYSYVEQSLEELDCYRAITTDANFLNKLDQLKHYFSLLEKVIKQTERRIIKEEQVPSSEKIVSIFEEHTDIIVKGLRDIVFGHKLLVATGVSGFITSFKVLDGNPADSNLVDTYIKTQKGRAPEELAWDGCFASQENKDLLKKAGCKELTFCKNKNIELSELCSSKQKHKSLIRFRAGVEGCISWLKRTFGLSRVLDKSLKHFKQFCHAAVAPYNLTVIARLELAKT